MIHAELLIASSILDSGLKEEFKTENADTKHIVTDSFGVDDARKLTLNASRRAWGGNEHHFVIAAKSMTVEAQNALLKLFEEPPTATVFHLIVPRESMLLSTLRSRLIKVDSDRKIDRSASEFLKLSLKEQLEEAANLAKDEPEAIGPLVEAIGGSERGKLSDDARASLLGVTKYVYNRGASRKMLLEELVLSLNNKN